MLERLAAPREVIEEMRNLRKSSIDPGLISYVSLYIYSAKSQYGSYAGGEGTSEKVVVGDPGGKDTIQIRQGGKKTPSHSLCSGEPLCLDQAIAYQIKAVELTPNDHAGRPMLPNNMGVSYMRRFERLGEFSDVEGGFLPRGRENWHRLDRAEGVVAVKQ